MTQTMAQATETTDVFPVQGVDHLQFLVGNAKQAAHYYSTAFGMTCVAYRGPEHGFRDHAEYVLLSGSARFLITGAAHAGAAGSEHVAKHSDGIADIALAVPDVDEAYAHATAAGATSGPKPLIAPRAISLSSRAWTVPRATASRRESSRTPIRGSSSSSTSNRASRVSS